MGKGKTCHLYLTKDHAIFLHYRISSQNDDRIAFTIDLSLRSIVTIYTEFGGSHSCPTLNRLQIKQPMPFLTFETSRYPDLTFSNSKPQDLPQTLVQNQECGLLHQVPKPVKLGLKIQVSEPISSEQSKFGVVSICLRRRPGVQIKIFIPLTRSFSSSYSLPPIKRPTLNPWCLPTDFNTPKIWSANSLVGDMIMLPTPSSRPHLALYSFSKT
ncbi:hypothetical protein LXL04_037434 [Taraxacum kok-saghyz]